MKGEETKDQTLNPAVMLPSIHPKLLIVLKVTS
jgi:hypothetical protein